MKSSSKSGFSLIELMITLVIASFLIMTMNTILQQTARSRRFVETRVKDGFFIGTLHAVLTNDFSGITIAHQTEITEKETKKSEQKIIPPIEIKRGPDNTIQEIRFFSVNAREYKKHLMPTEIVYTLSLVDKIKKTHKLTRTIVLKEAKTQKVEFQTPPVILFDNIIQLNLKFLKQKTKDEEKKDDPIPFVLLDEWSVKETKEKKEKPTVSKELNKEPNKELEDISHLQIIVTYIKNDRGAIDSMTLLIPIFFNKKLATQEKQVDQKKETEPKDKPEKTVAKKKKKLKEKSKEELAQIEKRTNSMLNLIFKGASS